MNLYGLFRVYSATFFVFGDYLKPSARIAALYFCNGGPQHFIWTHDSIGVGEMGFTHQPIEHFIFYEHYQTSIHLDLLMQFRKC